MRTKVVQILYSLLASPAMLLLIAYVAQVNPCDPVSARAAIPEYDAARDPLKDADIQEYLSVFSKEAKASIRYAVTVGDPLHYQVPASAHCHSNGVICLKPIIAAWVPEVAAHEIGHAYQFACDAAGHSWRKKWDVIRGGELTHYARNHRRLHDESDEDYAEWVQELAKGALGKPCILDDVAIRDDCTVQEKLAMVCASGIFTDEAVSYLKVRYEVVVADPLYTQPLK